MADREEEVGNGAAHQRRGPDRIRRGCRRSRRAFDHFGLSNMADMAQQLSGPRAHKARARHRNGAAPILLSALAFQVNKQIFLLLQPAIQTPPCLRLAFAQRIDGVANFFREALGNPVCGLAHGILRSRTSGAARQRR